MASLPPSLTRKREFEGMTEDDASQRLPVREGEASQSSLEYRRLQDGEVRIVVLESGTFGSPLHAKFEYLRLNDVEKHWEDLEDTVLPREMEGQLIYEAISYAWGSTDMPYHITLNGHLSVPLTTSLFQALQRFRHADRSRRLWADALCIWQGNLEEKSAQVAMMDRVFASARRVLMWLGESSGFDWLALHWAVETEDWWIEHLREPAEVIVKMKPAVKRCGCCADPNVDAKTGAEFDSIRGALLGYRSLVQRPWFSRLWVVQEFIMARDAIFQSGEHVFSANQLYGLTTFLEHNLHLNKGEVDLEGCDRFVIHRSLATVLCEDYDYMKPLLNRVHGDLVAAMGSQEIKAQRDISQLVTTMLENARRECSNPLDRIYAMNKVSGLTNMLGMQPDYSVSPIELFSSVAFRCLVREPVEFDLHPAVLLALAGHTNVNGGHYDWPSWVPAFDRLPPTGAVEDWERYSNYRHYSQKWTGSVLTCIANTLYELRVKGNRLAHIERLIPGSETGEIGSLDDYLFEEGVGNFFLRIAPSDIPINLVGMSRTVDNTNPHHILFRLASLPPDSDEGKALVVILLDPFWGSAYLAGRYCAIIRTETDSYIALVPERARPGDQLCILYGAPYPFVIRQRQESDRYELIGDALVHMMEESTAIGSDVAKQNTIVLR